MSGICGICDLASPALACRLDAMISAGTRLPHCEVERIGSHSAHLAVVRRWDFQQIASIPGVCGIASTWRPGGTNRKKG
jgi:hypothetical protein